MEMTIRNETPDDYREVENVTREAFWNLYVPGCTEHHLVRIMRSHPDFIGDLDFVAVVDGKIVGNIMYTKSALVDEVGREKDILTFGPISVLPEYQRKGVGGALIQHTMNILRKRDAAGVVILGDPHNYCKHGFKSSKDYSIGDAEGNFPYGMLALELTPGAFTGHAWKYRYSDVFNVDEKAAEEIDAGFPPKEKAYRYSQEIFSIAVRSVVVR